MNSNKSIPFIIGADNQYILYYSNFCINSKEFMSILSKSALHSKFIKINVSTSSFPSIIKSVPTIIVPNNQNPLVGIEVFNWLETQSGQGKSELNEDISSYSCEMDSNIGDNYSYLGSSDKNQPMEHSFYFISREEQKIQTPSEESFSTKDPKINTDNREFYPQSGEKIQKSSYGKPPLVPLESGDSGGKNVESAYNELLTRRNLDC